jgi:hypothetical protein
MPVTTSKLKTGTLTLDGVAFATQATNVRLVPPEAPSGDDVGEVLSGDPLPPETENPWVMALVMVQDFEDVAGFVNFTWTNQGEKVPYTWAPMGATGPSFSGTVTVWPVELGGEVKKRLTSEAEWVLDEKPARAEAGP